MIHADVQAGHTSGGKVSKLLVFHAQTC